MLSQESRLELLQLRTKEWTMMHKGGASLAPYYEFDSRIDSDVKTKVAAMSRKILGGGLVVGINDDEPKSTY